MKTPAVQFSWVLAVLFLLMGVLGFFPNPIVGEGAYFHTDLMHNIVHLATGLVALIVAMSGEKASVTFLYVFGIVYLLVALLGFLTMGDTETTSLLNLVAINTYDNWLHLVLGVVILGAGLYAGGKKM